MNSKVSLWHSLRTRAAVFTLTIFVLGIGSLSLYINQTLQSDMVRLLSEQQFSVATFVAKEVSDNLTERLQALETVAKEMDADLMRRPAAVQSHLIQRPLLQLLFNGGVLVASPDGTAIADLPLLAQRIGVNYMDRDYMVTALKEGKSAIGRPVIGKQLNTPIFAMAVPVRDAQGKVIGAIVGVTNLGTPSFLDKITQSPYGKTGGYVLISAKHRQVVTATDSSRVMETLPAVGVNAWVDRFANGYEGSAVAANPKGVEMLVSGKGIPPAGWYVLAALPTEEAFAPLHDRRQRLLWATLFMTLLTGALTWLVLKRQLAPLGETSRAMAALADSTQIPQPLALVQKDEIGQLVAGFNRILRTWTQREAALQTSEQNLAITLNSIGDAVIATDITGHITGMNPTAERLTAWLPADALGQPLVKVFRIISAQTRLPSVDPVQLVMERGEVVGLANHTTLLARDGHEYQIADSAAPIRNADGAIVGVVLVFSDVTEKYQAQEALHLTRFSVEAASDSVFWVTPDARIVDVNAATCRSLGYTREELLQLSVPDIDAHYSAALWPQHFAELRQRGSLTFESEQRTKDGRLFPVEIVANYVKHGDEERSCAFARDITERKRVEEGLRLSEERYRFSLEVTGQIGWSCRPDGQVEDVPMWRQYTGQSLEEVVGWKWLDAIHPDDRESANEAVSIAVAQKGSYSTEYRLRRADGVYRNFMVRGTLLFNADGSSKEWVGTCIDITERKQAQEALMASEERWKFAIEGAGDGLWDWNIQTGKAFYSSRYKTMLGFAEDEIGDTSEEWSKRIHPEDAPGVYAALQPYMDGKPGNLTIEFRMLCKDGSWLWTLGRGMVVQRDASGKATRMIGTNSDISAIKEHQGQLERMAHFDALTSLPNRLLLADRLQQAMAQAQRRGQQVAVAYLDLDGFKNVNDRYGHDVGDQLLIHLAKAMTETLREGDTLARLGGDEFVAVLIDLDGIESCLPLLARLLEAAAAPVPLNMGALLGSVSIGVTFYPQAHDVEADQLLRQADQAMYQAKLAGKNRYHIFDATQDSNMRLHHESLEHIRLALAQDEFVLHYQPKVNMRSGQVIGAEALIRWQHPDRGLLAPVVFLPVIEDHPLAVNVGEWVIDTALTQMERWHAIGLDLPVSVNIGARQLQQADFVQRLQSILANHPQVNPAKLELEMLETSALADMEQVSQVIESCRLMGVKFALDDFGTGYSSLSYLKRLRVALLKIDQSFVRDMLGDSDDLAILEGVIGMARAFKCEVIAEGVETVAHGTLLLQMGCELAQGYGIGRPMPPEQLPAWVAEWQPDAAWSELAWLGGEPQSMDSNLLAL